MVVHSQQHQDEYRACMQVLLYNNTTRQDARLVLLQMRKTWAWNASSANRSSQSTYTLNFEFFFFLFRISVQFLPSFFKEFYREKKNYTTLLARRVTEWNYTCEAKDVYIFFIQFFFCPKRVCMIVCSPISIPSCRISFFSDDS